jgi:site-specific DNA recombinase
VDGGWDRRHLPALAIAGAGQRAEPIADQEEALRLWCAENGYELLEVVRDEGHSGAYLERPGFDRVRDLVEAGGVALVVAQDADRLTREPGHRALLDEEFERFGTRLVALDDWGDDSHEGQLLRFLKGWVSKGERLKIAERTRRGRRQKAKQGFLVVPSTVPFGFQPNAARDGYEVDEGAMWIVRRVFQEVADGAGLYHVKRALETDAVPSPSGGRLWSRSTLRDFVRKDAYFPRTHTEISALVAPEVAAGLDPERSHGVAWASRHDWRILGRKRRADGTYRDRRKRSEKPREEWIAVPVPDAGVPREVAERARRNVEELRLPAPRADRRAWELSGGFAACAECGRGMSGRTVAPKRRKRGPYHYYVCARKDEEKGRAGCPNRSHRAEPLEARVRGFALRLIENPNTLRERVEQQARAERESEPWLRDAREAASAGERLAKLETVEDNYRDQQAEGLITMAKLREKLDRVREEREGLRARVAMLADGESRLREIEELPGLVEEYLKDLPDLVGRMPLIRNYETVPPERDEVGGLALYMLAPERIRFLSEEEVARRERKAEAARGARFRELYAMLGLRAEVHADGTLDIMVGATNAKGVMPWNEPGSPSTTSTPT